MKKVFQPVSRRWIIRVCFLSVSLILADQSFAQYSKLDDWMELYTKKMGGRAILIIYKNDSLIYNKSVGDMNHRQKSLNSYVAKKMNRKADPDDYGLDSRELIASCSKWYSAALIMTFVDEGRLGLADTVGKYLPVLSAHGKGNITISDCLSHLTGIRAPSLKKSLEGLKNISSMDQAIQEIADMPMEGEPGKTFHYSSVGLQMAASIVEKISGESFEKLFADRIAMPLGMKNTDFGNRPFVLPAGGATSTPGDYMNFLIMILHKGNYMGKQILSAESVNKMEMNRMDAGVKIAYTPEQADGLGYGYGEWVMKNSKQGVPSSWVTSPGLFGSFPWVDNENHYCAFLMTFYINNSGRQGRYFELKKLVDDSIR
jgi:CubicO group peptidase (beta-lactamase class C family)